MNKTPSRVVTDADLPASFRAADTASLLAQRRYVRWIAIQLALLVAGAVAATYRAEDTDLARALAACAAALLVAGLMVTYYLHRRNFERQWYASRALAESTKSLAWRYLSAAEPFQRSRRADETDRDYHDRIRDLRQQVGWQPVSEANAADAVEITPAMLALRAEDWPQRLEVYKACRIEQQRSWYATKAATSARAEHRFFLLVQLGQLAAVLCAVAIAVFWPDTRVNPVGAISALAIALLAWLQIKRHQELSQSYAIAAQELVTAAGMARHVEGDEAVAEFVADVETAISREHTLWLARRDVHLSPS